MTRDAVLVVYYVNVSRVNQCVLNGGYSFSACQSTEGFVTSWDYDAYYDA